MAGPFTYPVAESTPFEAGRNPDFNAEVGTLTAENVQDAIEEVFNTAPGTNTRFDAMCGRTGTSSNKWLEFFDSVSSDEVPFIMAEDGSLKALSVAVKISTTATITVYKNGAPIDTLNIVAGKKASKSGLSHALTDLDEISVKVTSGTVRNIVFHTFIQVVA